MKSVLSHGAVETVVSEKKPSASVSEISEEESKKSDAEKSDEEMSDKSPRKSPHRGRAKDRKTPYHSQEERIKRK